ncbi:MAG: DUF11 domain-containing protein [Candidatus Pacebacteria bacterium]|nr:DUF11 domain-containing protein [Candidatus Paceibacterota bacterium]
MMDVVRRIREFFKENPRMWIVVGVAVLVAGIFVWLAYRGSSVNVSQSSAQLASTDFCIGGNQYGNCELTSGEWNCQYVGACSSRDSDAGPGCYTVDRYNGTFRVTGTCTPIDRCATSTGTDMIWCGDKGITYPKYPDGCPEAKPTCPPEASTPTPTPDDYPDSCPGCNPAVPPPDTNPTDGAGFTCTKTFRSCYESSVVQHFGGSPGCLSSPPILAQDCGAGLCRPGNADNTAAYCEGSAIPATTPVPGTTSTPPPTTSGACTKRADGLWYCPNLSCGLAGNNGAAPAGPATSIQVSQFRTVCNDVEVPNNPQVGCKVFMDATPKIGALEGYPSKDPAWTCTGPAAITETEGRYCYTPFAMASAPGAVTCCTNTGLSGDCVSFTVAAASTTSGTTTPPVTGTPAAATLSLVCGATSNVLTWNIAARANSNTIQRMIPGGSWTNVFTDSSLRVTTYTDRSPVAGAQYRHKSGANVASNVVACSGSTGGGSTVVQGPPVTCSPARQSAKIDEPISANATGGNNVYTWNITQGGSIVAGGNEYVGVSYRTSGTKTLRVSSGGSSAICAIDVTGSVVAATPTSGPASNAQLFVTKTARNVTTGDPTQRAAVSVYPGQAIQFSIQVQNVGSTPILDAMIQDMLPVGMSFVDGSTLVNGVPYSGDDVISFGLSTGIIPAGVTMRVQWSAIADQTYSISPGPNYFSSAVVVSPGSVQAATNDDVVATVQVTVFGGSSSQQQAGEIPTGPGDAVLMALLTAAALTLLYSGYTRSSAYLRREAATIGKEKDPLDFRS